MRWLLGVCVLLCLLAWVKCSDKDDYLWKYMSRETLSKAFAITLDLTDELHSLWTEIKPSWEKYKQGKITETQYNHELASNIGASAGSIVGGVAGATIGSAVTPVGAIIGNRVGSYVGKRIGRAIGSSVYKQWTGYNEQTNALQATY